MTAMRIVARANLFSIMPRVAAKILENRPVAPQ
jgi:hypothetical protein